MNQNENGTGGRREESEADLIESIRQAHRPDPICQGRNDELIERALTSTDEGSSARQAQQHLHQPGAAGRDDDSLNASTDEIDQAKNLAIALSGSGTHSLLPLVEALRVAHLPSPIARETAERIAEASLQRAHAFKVTRLRPIPRIAATLAIAAGITLLLAKSSPLWREPVDTTSETLAQSRSVAPLFAETIEQGTPTQRIDRIYAVRSRELRHNRYVAWRVR